VLTRREALLGAAGFFAARAGAQPPGSAGASGGNEVLAALPGKKPLIQRAFRPPNFETPLADLAPLYTDNSLFFVRYHLPNIPRVDAASWRLEVGGPSAQRTLALSLRELKSNFERVSLVAVQQCSGNRRGLFSPRVPGVQWANGAMGNARWTGVRLRDVLRKRMTNVDHGHELTSERDLATLLEANMGVAVVPRSAARSATLMQASLAGLDLHRTVYVYGVAGRQRTPVASAILKMLRGADWSRAKQRG